MAVDPQNVNLAPCLRLAARGRAPDGRAGGIGFLTLNKTFLVVAFISAGMNFVTLKLGEYLHGESPLLVNVALCLPAAVLGSASWLMIRSFARSWQVVLCVAVAWLGLWYAFEIDKNRGLVAVSFLTLPLPIAALIVEHRCWWLCAKAYVLGNALAMGLALWFEYQNNSLTRTLYRFGYLLSNDSNLWLSNPNLVGGQLAFAAVLALIIYLREGQQDMGDRPRRFGLIWTVLLSLGCILTASRGAFVAWLSGTSLLVFWGTRSQEPGRLRDLVAVSSILSCLVLLLVAISGFSPWRTLCERCDELSGLTTGSGRTMIWKSAFGAWYSNPRYFFIGTGTGVAPEAMGEYLGMTLADGVTPAGGTTHNVFIEWVLSLGLLGIAVGVPFMVTACVRARRSDRRDGTVFRQAMLLCFSMSSMFYVTFYHFSFVAAAALILASLSEPAPAPAAAPGGRDPGWPLEAQPWLGGPRVGAAARPPDRDQSAIASAGGGVGCPASDG